MTVILPRSARRAAVLLISSLLLLLGLAAYLRTSAYSYPISDGAIEEIYTLHAVHGFWPFGPYSQFRWHHPGPLLFYLLAPIYALGGYKTIGLHVGALLINLASAVTIAGVLIRSAMATVALIGVAALGLFLYRADTLAGSYWNPHIVVLPVAALFVLCARLASGRPGSLPAVVFAGSFLAQTHVSLVPFVGVLAGVGLLAAFVRSRDDRRSLIRWIGVSAGLFLLLWLLPLVEQVRHGAEGNLAQLARFFSEQFDGPPWATVLAVWGDAMTAALRPGLKIPTGWGITVMTGYWLPALSTTQAVLLAVGFGYSARHRKFFEAALCGLGLVASLTALWSITRIRTLIGDYMVFWMSIVGLLNWATLAGLGVDALLRRPDRARLAIHRLAVATAAVALALFAWSGVDQIESARRYALRNPLGPARDVRVICDALDAYLSGEQRRRPMFAIGGGAWGDAAGVILDRYRRGKPFTISHDLVWMFGDPLVTTGGEDATIIVADRASHDELSRQPGDHLIAHRNAIYLHAFPPLR